MNQPHPGSSIFLIIETSLPEYHTLKNYKALSFNKFNYCCEYSFTVTVYSSGSQNSVDCDPLFKQQVFTKSSRMNNGTCEEWASFRVVFIQACGIWPRRRLYRLRRIYSNFQTFVFYKAILCLESCDEPKFVS
ncbi:hypothetical protein T02_8514 [Trichinella nativa]|uniref:Uncharacterized protein n=1 Tax=Trichinella nativa TaxID=6335 RepID=A0A0V1LR04_9BILA|nr:hypothetical protein T02_8514 [Trichinella nativa]